MPAANTPSTPYEATTRMTIDGEPVPPSSRGIAVAMVQGSQPDFSRESNSLLRDRLRLASLLLTGGYAAWLLKGLLLVDDVSALGKSMRLGLLTAVTITTGFVAARLCSRCPYVQRHLRLAEMVVFGSSAVLFAVVGYLATIHTSTHGYLAPINVPWLILIFTYALFIPNTWQRALAVIAPMSALPVILLLLAWWTTPSVTEVIRNNPDFQAIFLESAMIMTLGATIAVWGVKTIRSLRTEAFEARQLGQYRLIRLLGRGGMGDVYLAEHLLLKRPCAIKLIRSDRAGDPETLARFEREVQSTARLTHWNTVEIFDYGRAADGTFYYVMEYLPGMSLDRLVDMHGAMSPGRVIHLLSQACDALAEAHCQGLVHRDIKPANIFAARRGGTDDVTKLLDFGLVRSLHQQSDLKLTQEGIVTGSPLYMSPEQATGDDVDARSDIYALGCVAYYLLTGQPPFEETQPVKLILAHANKPPLPLSDVNHDIPADLEAVVLKCLEKDPRDRFQSVEDLREALQQCSESTSWTRHIASDWWHAHGCPKKKELDDCVCTGRALEPDDSIAASGRVPILAHA